MQGFCIRVARGLNKLMGQSGRVFAERYHVHILKTPCEVRRARAYVLQNARRHGAQYGRWYPPEWVDPFASSKWFDGWKRRVWCEELAKAGAGPPVAKAETWVMQEGWKYWGLIDPNEVPGRRRRK